ncbi:MAG: acyl-CoA desaturase [Verrucomicrobiota bacterium]|nr:acyl-CoA desaturase [Verrucomicrobiota bacterium]
MDQKKICWPIALFLVGYHLFLCIALPFYGLPSTFLFWTSFALLFLSGLAITCGYHRLYSHSAYKAHPITEVFFLFLASLAGQGSALRWCYDHRLHHAFVDTEKDPYTVKKGIFHAHMLWMFWKSSPIDSKVVSDLMRNRLLRFQHDYYGLCFFFSNAIVFLTAGFICGDYWGAFLYTWWFRLLLLHHTTWCINSLAHYWGTQNYSQEHSAVDNYIISLITYGEGYHNYHHTFAYDYRNGIRWFHFDPSKWLIWLLSRVGLARDLKRVDVERIDKQLLTGHRDKLLEAIKRSLSANKEAVAEKVTLLSERLSEGLQKKHALLQRYKQGQKDLFGEIRTVKKRLRNDWKEWRTLIKGLPQDS